MSQDRYDPYEGADSIHVITILIPKGHDLKELTKWASSQNFFMNKFTIDPLLAKRPQSWFNPFKALTELLVDYFTIDERRAHHDNSVSTRAAAIAQANAAHDAANVDG